METVAEFANSFVRRFKDFIPEELFGGDFGKAYTIRLHQLFSALDRPVVVLLCTYDSIRMASERDRYWLDAIVDKLPVSVNAKILILDADVNIGQAKQLLDNQTLGVTFSIVQAKHLFNAKPPADSIRDVVTKHLPLEVLSPYRFDHVASPRMFFGREDYLRKLLSHANGTQYLVGPRRIGKTSLAMRLKRERGNVQGITGKTLPRCSYVDMSQLGLEAPDHVWDQILRGFNLGRDDYKVSARRVKIGSDRMTYKNIRVDEATAVQTLIATHPDQLTIVLDEVDKWIMSEASQEWPTLDRLRSIADHGKVQVVLVGYEALTLAAQHHKFPFMGRGSFVRLGPLSFHDVSLLVVKPLGELGVRLEPQETIVNAIWSASSGMPNIVQDICSEILKLIPPASSGKAAVKSSIVQQAIKSSLTVQAFRNSIIDDQDFPLAEAIAGALSILDTTGSAKFHSIKEILAVLERENYAYDSVEVGYALAHLELRYLLEADDAARSRWKWTNDEARLTIQARINSTEGERWLRSVLRRHANGEWRRRYRFLQTTTGAN